MIYARQHTAQCVKILSEGRFETIRAGVIVYLISWKVFFSLSPPGCQLLVFFKTNVEKQDFIYALVLVFENAVRKQTQFFAPFLSPLVFLCPIFVSRRQFLFAFFSAFVENLAFLLVRIIFLRCHCDPADVQDARRLERVS